MSQNGSTTNFTRDRSGRARRHLGDGNVARRGMVARGWPPANILLVEANSHELESHDCRRRLCQSQPGVVAISMSFGQNDFSGENEFDSLFTTPNGHTGMTFLASTGDFGQPSGYPAYSPNVVAVGGTTLNVDGSGNYHQCGVSRGGATGGGVSTIEPSPAIRTATNSSTTQRTNPDVAFDADPNTGVPVDDSWDFGTSTPWQQFGGTSFSCPLGPLMAIADQGRVAAGATSLDGPSQTLPKLYASSRTDFNDITSETTGFAAGPGYDLVLAAVLRSAVTPQRCRGGICDNAEHARQRYDVVSTPPSISR